jgi:hypothetical protein
VTCVTNAQVERPRPASPRRNGKQTGPSQKRYQKSRSPGVAAAGKPDHFILSG